jgi:hypothetical protein
MSFRLVTLLALGLFAVATPAAAQLPCASPTGDCVLASTATVPVGTYDIRPRNLVLQNKTITISGAGLFKVLANNVTIEPGGRFIATGTDGNTQVDFQATGTIDLQSAGTSKSRIDVSGNFGGGSIMLHAGGNVTVIGTLIANATNLLGFGGPISLMSDTGNVVVGGDPSEGLKSFGNAQGGGGSINLDALMGSISIATQLVPKGGDCGSCEINLTAGLDITATAQGVMDLRASGIGDGGYFNASAGGNINLAGNILANGSSDELEGGTGGDVLISANGSVTIGGRVELNGAGRDEGADPNLGAVDGDGGASDISAGTFIQMNGPMFGISKGFGQGDEFAFDAFGNVTLAGEIDMTGDNYGGDISVLSEGLITVSARVRTQTPIDPVNKPAALGGTIDLEGCQIDVTSTGQVIATGPGGNPSGGNFLVASTGLAVTGALTATSINELTYRTSGPVLTGPVIPAADLVQNPSLPCCGVMCPTTTTSTSTTSTTSTSSTSSAPPTTSSTSSSTTTLKPTTTLAPTTTSTTTTVVPTTSLVPTTTSTTTTLPTTTTTSLASTTSSSAPSTTTTVSPTTTTSSTTVAPTTTSTTSSTVEPTTSTSTTVTPSTSSTTGTAPPPTTTTLPLTCFDTALGIDAVRCRLDAMAAEIGRAPETDLGGRKLARRFAARVAKATKLAGEPVKTSRLKKSAKQLRGFVKQMGKAVGAGKVNATLGATLTEFATEATAELDGLVVTN